MVQAKAMHRVSPQLGRSSWRGLTALLLVLSWATPRLAQAQVESASEEEIPAAEVPAADVPAEAGPPDVEPPTVTLAARRALVVDAIGYGIAEIVPRVVTDQIRRTTAELGYEVPAADLAMNAIRDQDLPYPPAPADLWHLAFGTESHRSIFARAWASEGRYVIEIVIASIDGTGPFIARDTAGADDLRVVVERLVRSTLPPPTQWVGAEPTFEPAPVVPAPTNPRLESNFVLPGFRRRTVREELAHPTGRDGQRWRPSEPDIRRFSLTVQTEASIGTSSGSFYNHYIGLRLDVRITREIIVGLYVAYVNLEAREGRANNIFVMLQGEDRIRLSPTLDLTIPLRVGIGYLPFNGPVFRASAGLNYAFSPNFELGLDVIAPTFYVLPVGLSVAFDFGLEGTYRF